MTGQVGSAILSLASIRIVTEFLDLDVFGDVALILAALVLAKGVFLAPILAAQVRFDPTARSSGTLGELYVAVARLGVLGLIAAVFGLMLAARGVGPILGISASRWLVVAVVGWLASDAVISAVFHLLNATRRQRDLVAARIADGIARPALGIVLILILSTDALSYVGGRAMGAAAVALFFVWRGRRALHFWRWSRDRKNAVRAWTRQLLTYGIPLVPLAGTQWVIHLADRYILEVYHGSAAVGVYAAAYALASQPMIMLGGSLALLLRPHMFEADADEPALRLLKRQWLTWLIGLGLVGVALMAVLHRQVAELLLASAYREGSGLFVIIGAGYLCLVIGQVYEVMLQVRKLTGRLLLVSVLAMLVSVTAALLLIPGSAGQGAAWSTFLGLATYAVSSAFAARAR